MKTYIYSEHDFYVFCNAVAMCLGWEDKISFHIDGTKFEVKNHYGSAFCTEYGEEETWRMPEHFFNDLEEMNPQKFNRPYEITA